MNGAALRKLSWVRLFVGLHEAAVRAQCSVLNATYFIAKSVIHGANHIRHR